MKNLRTIAFFLLILGGGTLILNLFNRRPWILSFLGEALIPVAIALAALGAVLFILSFIKFKKKEELPGKTDDTEKKQKQADKARM